MEENTKKEIISEVFQKVQMKAVLLGIPAILAIQLAMAPFLTGEKGDEGASIDPVEIVEKLKRDPEFIKSSRGVPGTAAALPQGFLSMFVVHKENRISKNCDVFCHESGFLGCVISGTGKHFAGTVKLENASCRSVISGPVDCICFK